MENKIQRNSNIELLRIVCILFVIMHHVLVHGRGIYNVEPYPWLYGFINQLCYVAVNVFILISGYFTIRFSWQKLLKLYLMCAVVGGLCYCFHCLVDGNRIGHSLVWSTMFPFSWTPVWYISVYAVLMLVSPFLNIMLEHLDKRQSKWLIAVLILISCYFGWFWHGRVNQDGLGLFQFVTMYCIGYEMHRCGVAHRLRMAQWGGAWVFFAATCTVLVYLQQTVSFGQAFPPQPVMCSYNNPFLMMAAIGLFGMFANMTIHNKVINYVAAGTLGVYIIHENPHVHKVLFAMLEPLYSTSFGGVLLSVVIIFGISWILDWVVRYTIVNPLYKLIVKFVDIRISNIAKK